MRGQSEIIVFVLLTFLSIAMLMLTTFWSKDVFQKNVGMASVSNAESMAMEIDAAIKDIVKFEGSNELDYNVEGPILLVNDNILEIRTSVDPDLEVSKTWVNISSEGSFIREVLEGDVLRVQLTYPKGERSIVLFTDGPTMSKPQKIILEKNQTSVSGGNATIKIRVTFT